MTEHTENHLKRLLDFGGSLGALILLSPLLLLTALLILVCDGTPVLFQQTRIGRKGNPFRILKFRTMRAGSPGRAITTFQDIRITPLGRVLRKLKIDELPQLWNVLRGDMSLIGPRPEVPEFVEFEDARWRTVLEVRPGVTDLASLAFRNEEEMLRPAADPEVYYRAIILPQKLNLNLHYQRSRSFSRDLKLLWMTARYSFIPWGFDRDRILRSLGAL